MFRPIDEPIDELLAASRAVRTTVECWRGDEYLGSAPLDGGELTENADQFVTQTLDLDVAALDPDDGRSWVPATPYDPLAAFGQRCYIDYAVQRASGEWLTVGLGWFILDEWELDGDVVSVSALDLRDALRTSRLLGPTSPLPGGTFVSELRRLVGGRLPLDVTGAPVDRAVPSGMAWQESRTDAVDELLAAWPARLELDATGTLVVLPDTLDDDPADVVLVEGAGGTIVQAARAGSRDGLSNVIVARGADPDTPTGSPITGYASDNDPSSPTFAGGPMGELVEFLASPLLRTTAQATKAAETRLRRTLRGAELIPVTCLPDPRIGVNTRVDLTRRDGTTVRTVVTSSKLPLTGAGGAQALTLGVIRDA